MTRLQGTWLFTRVSGIPQAEFFLWGEEWRGGVVASDDSPFERHCQRAHPYCMSDRDLTTWLKQQSQAPLPAQTRFAVQNCELQLPTAQGLPIISEGISDSISDSASEAGEGKSWQLQTWQLQGVSLSIAEAYQWLSHLPLHRGDETWAWMSDSLLYWVHVMRWSMSLMVRGKYLPQVALETAYWGALLDSATDQSHLQHFVQNLPESCRFYRLPESGLEPLKTHQAVKGLVVNVVDAVINYGVRSLTATIAAPTPALTPWLKPAPPNKTQITEAVATVLHPQLDHWYAPLQNAESAFRVAVKLQPPQYGSRDWRLEYGLQAVSDQGIWINAAQVWKSGAARFESSGLRLDDPHETFLAGLGNASKLFPIIESSLKTSKPTHSVLDAYQAYELIKSTRFKLSDNGIGVVLPPGLSDRNEQTRFGLKLSADLPKLQDGHHLGLQGMLNFKWDLAIGKQTISKAEFDRLVALNMPIVEINGEWIEFKPQDIRAAQAFFENRKANPTLTLEDVLRISSGDGKIIEKLTVVDFEASGVLQELIGTLQNNQTPAPIESPAGFKGQLRPYQSRGAGWLAFLERWGLGACLADDMGLGKTVQLLTLLLHLKEQKRLGGPTLLICPTSVIGNWEREVRKFAPSLKVMLHHGANRSQGQGFEMKVRKVDLVITSYALAMRDLPSLKPFSWRGLVLDEAQNIKNAEAKQTQAIMELKGQFRIALTGKPFNGTVVHHGISQSRVFGF
jgi:hypothetical protein